MAEEKETLILGVGFGEGPFEYQLPLYWDKSKGNEGYHAIRWKETDTEFTIVSRSYIWGTGQGVDLDEIITRSPKNWFWVTEPIPLFPGSHGFYMKQDLADRLKSLCEDDAFSGIKVCKELYDRDIIMGFGTPNAIKSRREIWSERLHAFTDTVLKQYLKTGNNEADAKKVTNELMYLSTTESQAEQAKLRYLMIHKPDLSDRIVDIACDSMASTYEMYDKKARTGLVKRTDDRKRIIVPPDKIFANPQNVRRGIQELKIKLMEI